MELALKAEKLRRKRGLVMQGEVTAANQKCNSSGPRGTKQPNRINEKKQLRYGSPGRIREYSKEGVFI